MKSCPTVNIFSLLSWRHTPRHTLSNCNVMQRLFSLKIGDGLPDIFMVCRFERLETSVPCFNRVIGPRPIILRNFKNVPQGMSISRLGTVPSQINFSYLLEIQNDGISPWWQHDNSAIENICGCTFAIFLFGELL